MNNNILQNKIEELEKKLELRFTELAQISKGVFLLHDRLESLTAERNDLASELKAKCHELALLGKRCVTMENEARNHIAFLQNQLDATTSRWTWKFGAPFRFAGDKSRSVSQTILRLPISLRILLRHRKSGIFDPTWYCAQNPDVAIRVRRPFLHFAFHGVFEGRAPNPSYKETHKGCADSTSRQSINSPLLAYLFQNNK